MVKNLSLLICVALLMIGGVLSVKQVLAGGCCYINYKITPGLANKEPAKVTTAFVNPIDIFTDETKTKSKPITGQKVGIQILNPSNGQACFMTSEITDAEGYISAECVSPKVGDISVIFSLADNPGGVNEILKTVPLKLHFDGEEVEPEISTLPTIRPTSIIVRPTHIPTVTPIMIQNNVNELTYEESKLMQTNTEDQAMQERITQLENEVARQKQEVTGLRAIVNQLLSTLGKIFHFGS